MGVHLRRTADDREAVDVLADAHGGRVGLQGVLDDLARRARPSYAARLVAPGLHRAIAWSWRDRYGVDWYPQGVSGSWDARDDGLVEGRELLAVSWYSRRGHGSRITLLDLASRRYQHVRLVHPDLRPVQVHAGGLVWHGPHLHVAATARGLLTFRLDDVVRVAGELVLPLAFALAGEADPGTPRFRYSFVSLDRSGGTTALVAGEYAARLPTRFVRYPLDPVTWLPVTDGDGIARPDSVDDRGLPRMQGMAVVDGTWFVTTSSGLFTRGSVHTGRPELGSERFLSTPWGPEDLSGRPQEGEIWGLSEHPWGRWVWAVRTDPT